MGFYSNTIFPWILDNTEAKEMPTQRRLALANVSGRVLEIGIGSGGNLPFYPDAVDKLTAVEPSSGMQKRAVERIEQAKMHIDWHKSSGEKLPFENDYFDSVVTTQLLCSVTQINAILSEIARVLKPGGKYFFLEHGISESTTISNWQHRLNSIHKRLACGCELTRDIAQSIHTSALTVNEMITIPAFDSIDQKIYAFVRGVAQK